jgi:hypothetical protein
MVAGMDYRGLKVTLNIMTETGDPMHPARQIRHAIQVKTKTSFMKMAVHTAVTEVAGITCFQSSIAPLRNHPENVLVKTWR